MSLYLSSPVSSANHQSSVNPSSATPLLIAASLLAFGFCSSAPAATVEKISIAEKPVTIKVPDQPAPGKPWLWVGEFPGVLKSLENGLVEKGWHVVHVGVGGQWPPASLMPPAPALTDDILLGKQPAPNAVRYGWANVPAVNLYNQQGLPASPFRTDVD
jgi:hypothetical protein